MSWIITCSYLKKKKNPVEIEILPDAIIITVSRSLNFRQLFGDKLKENRHLFYWSYLLCVIFVFTYVPIVFLQSSYMVTSNNFKQNQSWLLVLMTNEKRMKFLMRLWLEKCHGPVTVKLFFNSWNNILISQTKQSD